MEADWEVEIGPDAPRIVVPWDGFIDLHNGSSEAIQRITEAADCPPLREALIQLNSAESPVFTSKCDIWNLNGEEIDKDEFGARPENARCATASYIDVLLLDSDRFQSFGFHELLVRRMTDHLRAFALANCRVDLVIRAATLYASSGCGITIYASGCGADERMAYSSWQDVLHAAVNVTMKAADFSPARASSSIG